MSQHGVVLTALGLLLGPLALTPATAQPAYDTSRYFLATVGAAGSTKAGCTDRNELGVFLSQTMAQCQQRCDDDPTCVSAEQRWTNTWETYTDSSTAICHLSSSCTEQFLGASSNFRTFIKRRVCPAGTPSVVPSDNHDTLCVEDFQRRFYVAPHATCSSRNELGVFSQKTVVECMAMCLAEAACVSIEIDGTSTLPTNSSRHVCQLSSSCTHALALAGGAHNWVWFGKRSVLHCGVNKFAYGTRTSDSTCEDCGAACNSTGGCPLCPHGARCGANADCAVGYCDVESHVCATPPVGCEKEAVPGRFWYDDGVVGPRVVTRQCPAGHTDPNNAAAPCTAPVAVTLHGTRYFVEHSDPSSANMMQHPGAAACEAAAAT